MAADFIDSLAPDSSRRLRGFRQTRQGQAFHHALDGLVAAISTPVSGILCGNDLREPSLHAELLILDRLLSCRSLCDFPSALLRDVRDLEIIKSLAKQTVLICSPASLCPRCRGVFHDDPMRCCESSASMPVLTEDALRMYPFGS